MRLFVALSALVIMFPGAAHSDSLLDRNLQRQVTEQTLTAPSALQALFRLSAEYEIPMGVIWIDGPSSETPINVPTGGMTVAQALQKIVSLMPDEALLLDGSVVHVLSRQTGAMAPWLSITFPEYRVDNEFISVASLRLRQKIQAEETKQLGAKRASGCGGHLTLGRGDAPISLHLSDATVERILDSFVEQSGLKIWIVTLAPNQIDSRSLFSSAAIPQQDQPYWELLPWGVDPKSGGFHREWLTPVASKDKQ